MWICDECLKKYYENKPLFMQNMEECNICRRYIMCSQISLRDVGERKNENE